MRGGRPPQIRRVLPVPSNRRLNKRQQLTNDTSTGAFPRGGDHRGRGDEPRCAQPSPVETICLLPGHGFQWLGIHLASEQDQAIPAELAEAAESYYIGLIRTKPGLKRFWAEYKFAWVDPFLTKVDSLMVAEAPERPVQSSP